MKAIFVSGDDNFSLTTDIFIVSDEKTSKMKTGINIVNLASSLVGAAYNTNIFEINICSSMKSEELKKAILEYEKNLYGINKITVKEN